MKKGKLLRISTISVLTVMIMLVFIMPVRANKVFPDLTPEHWCYNKIIDFEQKGYVCGYVDGTFRADQTITRAEYVKIVNNFFGYELEYDKNAGFSDVDSDEWYAPYVNEAVERGYINGYEDGTFRPENPIRRQEATVILARILEERFLLQFLAITLQLIWTTASRRFSLAVTILRFLLSMMVPRRTIPLKRLTSGRSAILTSSAQFTSRTAGMALP